jgi:hypothetical protein
MAGVKAVKTTNGVYKVKDFTIIQSDRTGQWKVYKLGKTVATRGTLEEAKAYCKPKTKKAKAG